MNTIFDEIQFQKANKLLGMLNDGLKPSDHYEPVAFYEEKGITVFIAANKDKNIMCNALDFEGKTPNGFSANWRIHDLVKKDLNEIK